MDKFTELIEKRIAPLANKIGKQKYLQAISNTFLTLIPFMTIGSFALILLEPPVNYSELNEGVLRIIMEGWASISEFAGGPLYFIYSSTMENLSLFVAVGIGYYLSVHYKLSGYVPILLSAGTFLIVNSFNIENQFTNQHFGGTGLFSAMIVSILTIELFRIMIEKEIGKINLSGSGVPPALTQSLASLVPIFIILTLASLFSLLIVKLTGGPFPELMSLIMEPVVQTVDSPFGVVLLSAVVMIFWWFGIHDSVITGPLSAFLLVNLTSNMQAYNNGTPLTELPYILTGPLWWSFMAIGGSGATFGLIILLLTSKSKHLKTIGKLGIIPSFFNINEPVIFGLPIMLNPVMFFPFIINMPLNGLITYLAMDFQLINRTVTAPSWNTFGPLGALIATLDYRALILALILVIVNTLIYYPFFKVFEKQKIQEELGENNSEALKHQS